MSQIPTPLRAALGLVANTIEGARTLPDKAVELPVMAVSAALQFSLRAQQRYAELTLRGDELLSRLHGLPEEPPDWAIFDDEQASVQADDPAMAPAVPAAGSPAPSSQPMTSAAKQSRVRKSAPAKKSAAKKTVVGKAKSTKRATAGAKTVRAKRSAKPSAFDAVGDAGTQPDGATPGTSEG